LALGPRRSSVEELVRRGGRRTGGWSRSRDAAVGADAGAGERTELTWEGGSGAQRWGGGQAAARARRRWRGSRAVIGARVFTVGRLFIRSQ
jgi:hypothetical protein